MPGVRRNEAALTSPQSSVRVPDQVEGTDWLDGKDELGPEHEFWAFQEIAKVARENAIVSRPGTCSTSHSKVAADLFSFLFF